MVPHTLKQRITDASLIPALPHLTLEALRAPEDDRAALVELAAIASFDEHLAAIIVAEAHPQDHAPTLEEAVLSLGLPRLREVLFQTILPSLFRRATDSEMARDSFWEHAHACGTYAARISSALGGTFSSKSYVAGLLHDIGKLAIDTVCEDGYGAAIDANGFEGLHLIEGERAAYGTDHTVAGKWLAERWALPEEYISAIWLHHHPPGSLDDTAFAVTLIDIVALANALAHRRSAEFGDAAPLTTAAEALRKRLGLAEDDLEALVAKPLGAGIPNQTHKRSSVDTSVDVDPDAVVLRRQVAQYRVLHALQMKQTATASFDELADGMVGALREAFGPERGAIVAQDQSGQVLACILWHDREGPSEVLPLPSDGYSSSRCLSDLLQELQLSPRRILRIDDIEIEEPRTALAGTGHSNMLVLPLASQHRTVGQLLVDPGKETTELFVESLFPYTEMFGKMLAQYLQESSGRQHAEDMAASLLHQELDYRGRIREERLDSVRKLVAGAAHEINNPLTVILGRAQILLSRSDLPEINDGLEAIIQESRRASKVLTDLMQFTRSSELHRTTTSVGSILRHVVATMRSRLEQRGITLVQDYELGKLDVCVDRHQIEQVFVNLIVNAEQAMEDGGILTLRVTSNHNDRMAVVQIVDTGEGIPASVLGQIFEPFFTTRGTQGTGLGLSVCHGIVDNHQGTLTVHSVEGEGTTCTLTLPRHLSGSVPKTPRSVPARPVVKPVASVSSSAPRSILLADSDEELVEILRAALTNQGYHIEVTNESLEALAFAIGYNVDLAIVGLSLQGEDGVPLYRQIHACQRDLPIVALCGSEPEEILDDVVRSGASLCLRKPFAMAQFLAAIAQALSMSRVA